jgi:uncharacterized protein
MSTLEIREASGGGLTLTGLASKTNVPYTVGYFTETIAPGAFKRTLSERPEVALLLNHEGLPLASTTAGSLSLWEDGDGLQVKAELDGERSDVRDIAAAIRRKDIREMSFAFRATKQAWDEDYEEREVLEVDIDRGDVSVVTFGANPQTEASMRARMGLSERRAAAREIGDVVRGGRLFKRGVSTPVPATKAMRECRRQLSDLRLDRLRTERRRLQLERLQNQRKALAFDRKINQIRRQTNAARLDAQRAKRSASAARSADARRMFAAAQRIENTALRCAAQREALRAA